MHIIFGWMLITKQNNDKKKKKRKPQRNKLLAEQVLLALKQIGNLCSLQQEQASHFLACQLLAVLQQHRLETTKLPVHQH